eukprot:2276601-Amphidinium_carterae.1
MRMQRVMRLHGGYWRGLSPEVRAHWQALEKSFAAVALACHWESLAANSPIYASVAAWDELSLADYTLMWTFQAGDFEHTDVLADADVLEVGVVLRTTFKATRVLVSKDVVQPLESVLQALEMDAPETTRGTEQTRSASASASTHVPLEVDVPSDEDALSEVSADEAMSLACAEVVADHAVLETSESTLHECFRMQLIGGRGAGSADRLGMNGLRVE